MPEITGARQEERINGMEDGGHGKDRKGGITTGDLRLWKEFTRDIDPLEEPDWQALEDLIAAQEALEKKKKSPALYGEVVVQPLPEKQPTRTSSQPPQLDARTEQKIKRGQMPIEGTLDLHGKNQEQAHRQLQSFVMSSHAQGKRCLLIITGKGRSTAGGEIFDIPEGVLKQKVPMWLFLPPLNQMVLKIFTAQPKHGGGGALYVYLRRNRDQN